MLALISPAKTLDMTPADLDIYSSPALMTKSEQLIKVLSKKSKKDLAELMHLSDKLALLNYQRYQSFDLPFTPQNAKQALLAFKGDVYVGLDAQTLNKNELKFAQKHLGILSGLYGYLRPLDLIQAYRLEMGTKLKIGRNNNLYAFWGDDIKRQIEEHLKTIKSDTIINLASNEYFKAIQAKALQARIIDIVFKEYRGEELKFISFHAKKARGLMSRYIIKNRLTDPEALKGFDLENYYFEDKLSEEHRWVFVR